MIEATGRLNDWTTERENMYKHTITLETKPDFEKSAERMEAFWNRAILDRPFIQVVAPNPNWTKPYPVKQHASIRERWLDIDHKVDCAIANVESTWYGGDSIPIFMPNLGPEIMTTAYGAAMEFSETTSWTEPCLTDLGRLDALKFDPENFYIRHLMKMIEAGLERGRGKFLTGLTDIHPGGDLAASLRNPQDFCMDLVDSPELCERLLAKIQPDFAMFYDMQYDLLKKHGQWVTSSWIPFFTEGRFYIPSNDFSCMVSPEMFDRFFLGRLAEECAFLDRSIYHLDGPGALCHLPSLLSIKDLDAIQWVSGAGNGPDTKWMKVFQEIQAAGKAMQIWSSFEELDVYMENLRPEGVALCTWVRSVEEGEAYIRKASTWTKKGA